jgi:hypothetical protein
LALVSRALQIPEDTWLAVLASFAAQLPPPAANEDEDGEIERCVAALASAYGALSPHAAPPPAGRAPERCIACGHADVRPFLARRSPTAIANLVYGRCDHCGHGALLDGPGLSATRARYADAAYFRARDADGVGYDGYDADTTYRERKGAILIERVRNLATPAVRRLLEVGSGYGFTRAAGERAGLRTAGVDVSAHTVSEAARRYGLRTFHGTLAEALASPQSGVERGAYDAVLYQFVLEHVADPVGELALAREALAPDGGWLVLLIPSMEAAEITAFGASYRSFRADHLHLFSRASLVAVLDRAGFELRALESHCNMHLLRGLLSARALERLYATGRGPDLFVLAQRQP